VAAALRAEALPASRRSTVPRPPSTASARPTMGPARQRRVRPGAGARAGTEGRDGPEEGRAAKLPEASRGQARLEGGPGPIRRRDVGVKDCDRTQVRSAWHLQSRLWPRAYPSSWSAGYERRADGTIRPLPVSTRGTRDLFKVPIVNGPMTTWHPSADPSGRIRSSTGLRGHPVVRSGSSPRSAGASDTGTCGTSSGC
jgi:hypothetical protein